MIPWVKRAEISKLDKLMVKNYKIPIVMMMELAGYRLAEFMQKEYREIKKVLIIVGKGNNGGDGLSAARHLLNFGFKPKIFLIETELKGEPKMHLDIVRKLKIPIISTLDKLKLEIEGTEVILDCLIGYNLKGEPKGKFKTVIDLINELQKPVVSCDIPSGIDADKGASYKTFIKAESILFLSLPKWGCKNLNSKKFVADIGVPKTLYPKIKVKEKNYFENESIIKLG